MRAEASQAVEGLGRRHRATLLAVRDLGEPVNGLRRNALVYAGLGIESRAGLLSRGLFVFAIGGSWVESSE